MTSFAIAGAKVIASITCIYMVPSGAMRLRTRGHDYKLPTDAYDFNKGNSIFRSLSSRVILSCFIVAVQFLC